MSEPPERPGLGHLLRAGARALRAHWRLFAGLYLIQVLASGAAAWIMARILAGAWARGPLLERAQAGDVAALLLMLRSTPEVFIAMGWVAAGAIAAYGVLSWYLAGGLNAALLTRRSVRNSDPRGAMRRFGAGGLVTLPAYARLALLSLLPWLLIALLAAGGMYLLRARIEHALTVGQLLAALVPALALPAALCCLQATAAAYARIDLSQRALIPYTPQVRLSAARSLLGAYRTALFHRQTLLHVLLYALWFAAVSALYAGVTAGRPMTGAAGALGLLALRQIAALLRGAGAFVLAGGQVAFTTRAGA